MAKYSFMQWARDHIHELGDLTSNQIAQRFLDLHPGYSPAEKPVLSLGESLAKSVRTGHEPTIERRGHPFRYYPKKG